ncbi:MAG: acyl-CoA thioesterase domain-containing protein [Sphingobium sp.]
MNKASTALFDLNATHNPHRWYLTVTPNIVVGPPEGSFMFGGIALAAAISAMEQTCAKPVIWATAHYLSFARPGSIVDLDVRVDVEGKHISQASVIEQIGDRRIVTVHAALGEREGESDQWITIPVVPPPEECAEVSTLRPGRHGIQDRFETRLAGGRYPERGTAAGRGSGNVQLWFRSREGHLADRQLLAVAADFVSVAIAGAIGRPAGGNSLDNTIRFGSIESVEWVLLDIEIETIDKGLVHGAVRLFSPSGRLMATASQSLILRLFDQPGRF